MTADRPAAVTRSLESLVRHCESHGRRPRVLVIDGSQSASNQAATRSAVSIAAATSGHDLQYFGHGEATRFSERLARQGACPPTLAPGSAGANRNLLLLLTAGEQILTLDDDVLTETWTLPDRREGLLVAGHDDLRETVHVTSRAAALAAATRTPVDLLAAHGALLGQSLPALIAASSRAADLAHACHHLLSGLAEGRPQIVKVTFAGLAGDAATYCPHRMLLVAGPRRARLWASLSTFEMAMSSREVLRIARTPTVTHNSNCMAYCMGVSNRTLTPPFMPVGRNEDGVFGLMSAACDPATLFGHLPVGILHDSGRPSEYAGAPMPSAREARLSELVIALVRQFVAAGLPSLPGARMQSIGARLTSVASLPDHELAALVATTTTETRRREFQHAEEAAKSPECPGYWRAALDRYHAEFLAHVDTPGFSLPSEFHGLGSLAAGYRALRAALHGFGALLAGWPALWEVAGDLNAQCQER